MPRTQVKAQNILDHSLTGASFRTEMRYYDETLNYSQGAIVSWAGREYQANTSITGTTEGDLSNAPNVSTDWNLYTNFYGQLEKITENNNTGYRLRGRDPDNYGDIGIDAVDFSISNSASTTSGATSDGTFAVGYKTEASWSYAAAFGSRSKAAGISAFASGTGSEAAWDYCHAEGYYCTAGDPANNKGNAAHSEGFRSAAKGNVSHAEGYETIAEGDASHSEGYSTIAQNDYMHAAGKYNTGTATDTIHETGIGADDSNRKNAFEIYTDGRLVAPELTTTLINTNRSLVTKEYVDDSKSNFIITDFDASSGQTDFTVTNLIFNVCQLFINGILQRSNSYTISNNGSDTTIVLDTGTRLNDWVSIVIVQ